MSWRVVIANVALTLPLCACGRGSRNSGPANPPTGPSARQPGQATGGLPVSKTKVTFQQKSTKALGTAERPFYEVVDQWVFQADGGDDALICVEDGEHCIALEALRQQLVKSTK